MTVSVTVEVQERLVNASMRVDSGGDGDDVTGLDEGVEVELIETGILLQGAEEVG